MTTYFHDLQAESIVISAGNDDGTLFSIVAGGTTVFSVDDNGLLTMTGDVTLDDLTVGDDVTITGDLAVTGNTTFTGTVAANGSVTMGEADDIVLGSTTGSKIGTATTQKLAFYNSTPIVQPGAYTQTYSTANKTIAAPTAVVTGLASLSAITGGESPTEAEHNLAVAQINYLITAVTALIADDLDNRQTANALIDDLQALGLVG